MASKEKKVVADLVRSLKAFVERVPRVEPEATAVGSKPSKLSVFLSLFAIACVMVAVTAAFWAASDVTAHPYVSLLIKTVPALGGVAITSYLDAARERLIALAANPWFRGAAFLAALLLFVPQIVPYWVPLKVRNGAIVHIDSVLAPLIPYSDSIKHIKVSGLQRHTLVVAEYVQQHRLQADTFTIGKRILLKSFARSVFGRLTRFADFNLPVAVLTLVPVDHPKTAVFLGIRGVFPPLYLVWASSRLEVHDLPGDTSEVWIVLPGGISDPVYLPEGVFDFRFYGPPGCWSTYKTDSVKSVNQASVDLNGIQCAP